MQRTTIEWATHSSNPIYAVDLRNNKRGHYCTKVSRGCKHCYAETLNHKWGNQLDYTHENAKHIQFFVDHGRLNKIKNFTRPARVFLQDMSDLFHPSVPDRLIIQVLAASLQAKPFVHSLLLTKQIERACKLLTDPTFITRVYEEIYGLDTADFLESARFAQAHIWPPKNIHIGTSIEDQRSLHDRGKWLSLLTLCGWTTFYSLEPMIAPVDFENVHAEPVSIPINIRNINWYGAVKPWGAVMRSNHSDDHYIFKTFPSTSGIKTRNYLRDANDAPLVHGVIVGGESGQGAVPLHPELPRTIRDVTTKYRMPFMFKQWGAWIPIENTTSPTGLHGELPEGICEPSQKFPNKNTQPDTDPYRYVCIGKNQAGNILDRRQHLHIPNRECALITQDQWLQTAKENAA